MSFGCHVVDAQRLAKSEVVASKRQAAGERAAFVCDSLPSDVKRMISLLSEKGASSWLSALATCGRAWFCSPQGCFSRCSFLALWVASFWVTRTLCLWPGFLCGSCFKLSNWGYPTKGYDTFGNLVRLARNQGKSQQKSLEIRKSGFTSEITIYHQILF